MKNLSIPASLRKNADLFRKFSSPARLLLAAGLAAGLLLLLLGSLNAQAAPACSRYVFKSNGADTTTCSDINHPCKTISWALRNAVKGDRICVASHAISGPLTYAENLYIAETVFLDGAWEASCTFATCQFSALACKAPTVTIDAGGNGRAIKIDGKIGPIVNCFTITGGDATGLGGDPGSSIENDAGGGIYVNESAAIITNNVITGNFGCKLCPATYGRGGGIYMYGSPPSALIENNKIIYNVADDSTWGKGGGIMLRESDAQVSLNTIQYNRAGHSAGDGGGIAVVDGAPTISDNTIQNNIAAQSVMGVGGGIYVWSGEAATIERNVIKYNQAISGAGDPILNSRGGGIYYNGNLTAAPSILDNQIIENIASPLGPLAGYGGGAYLINLVSPALVSANTFTDNIAGHNEDGYGGGISVVSSTLTLRNNTFTNNSATWAGSHGEGGGLYISGGSVLAEYNEFIENFAAGFLGFPSEATGYGGGAAVVGGSSTLQFNTFLENYATRGENWGMGGGIFANQGEPQILSNNITENYATANQWGSGGGVAISGCLALVQGNMIAGNVASVFNASVANSGEGGTGGGLFSLNAEARIERNTLLKNVAAQIKWGYGGGGYVQGSNMTFDSNYILGNTSSPGADSPGGGLRLVINTYFTFMNNVVAANSASSTGSGLSVLANSGGTVANNTIAENLTGDGVGVYVKSAQSVTLYNNVIVSQTIGIVNDYPTTTTVSANYTLFENNVTDWSLGVSPSWVFAGPALLSPSYHLLPGSNAIDHAIEFGWLSYDIDFDSRPKGPFPDLGADEFVIHLWLPQILKLNVAP